MTKARDNATQGGLVLISTGTMPSNSQLITFTNVFSSRYENYRIVFNGTSTENSDIMLRLGTNGTQDTGTPYLHAGLYSYAGYGATGAVAGGTGLNSFRIVPNHAGVYSGATLDLYGPNMPKDTNYTCLSMHGGGNGYAYYINGVRNTTTQYTDATIYAVQGSIGGTVSIYGYIK